MKKFKNLFVPLFVVVFLFVTIFTFAGCDLFKNNNETGEREEQEQVQDIEENNNSSEENQGSNENQGTNENQGSNEEQGSNGNEQEEQNQTKDSIEISYAKNYSYAYDEYQAQGLEQSTVAAQIEEMSDGMVPANAIEELIKSNGNYVYTISISEDSIPNKQENKSLADYIREYEESYISEYANDNDWTCMNTYIPDANTCFFKTIEDRDVLINVDSNSSQGFIEVLVVGFNPGSIAEILESMPQEWKNNFNKKSRAVLCFFKKVFKMWYKFQVNALQ